MLQNPGLVSGAKFVIMRVSLRSPAALQLYASRRLHFRSPREGSTSFNLTRNPQRLFTRITRYYSSSSGGHPPHRPHKDLYSVLGVSPKATQQQIKDQFYKLSMLYHPDRNRGSQGAHQRFSEITEAYSILGQHVLRRKYDKGLLQEYPRKPHPDSHHHDHHTGADREYDRAMSGSSGQKKIYDFDEFYRAHYGEALKWQRERTANRKMDDEKREKLAAMSNPMHRALTVATVLLVLIVGWVNSRYKKHLWVPGKWA